MGERPTWELMLSDLGVEIVVPLCPLTLIPNPNCKSFVWQSFQVVCRGATNGSRMAPNFPPEHGFDDVVLVSSLKQFVTMVVVMCKHLVGV